jgi:hypothetical protein
MHLPEFPDQSGRQRHLAEIIQRKQLCAQTVVDIVSIVGDVIGKRCNLRALEKLTVELCP